MIDQLNHPWIALPILYILTVAGLIAGFRRAGVPLERAIPRAVLSGPLVMLVVWVLWNIIIAIFEAQGAPHQFDTLDLFLAFIFFPCSSALAAVALARRKPSSPVERGTVIIDVTNQQPATPRPGELTLAGQRLALIDETLHFKIIGTTGTGKSTAFRELLTRALARGDRAVIADPNGDYARDFYDPTRGDIILSPFDARAARWDLFAEIIEPHDADQLAASLIPDNEGENQIWRNYAQTFLTAVLRQLHRAGRHDLATLYRVLVDAKHEDLRDLLEGTPAAPYVDEDNGKFLGSVRAITTHHLKALEHLMRQPDGNAFSVRKWIREGRGVLFLPYRANEIVSLKTVISTWMYLAIFETMSLEEGDHRLWFVIDELDALGPINGLKDALARLRKFGGRCLIGLQSIAQLRGTYGDTAAQTIAENCGTTVILRCSASERGGTAEFASRLIGQREVTRQQFSNSRPRRLFGFLHQTRTVTDYLITEPAVLPSEIEQLPNLSGYLKIASQPHWYRVKLSWKI